MYQELIAINLNSKFLDLDGKIRKKAEPLLIKI